MKPPTPIDPDLILFSSPTTTIGRFRCPTTRPDFTDTGPTGGFLAVFPRTAVQIQHDGHDPVLADPNVTMLYNRAQHYRRAPVSPRGDHCEWFALAEPPLRDILASFDPRAAADHSSPIRFTHAPSPPRTYLLQRLLVRTLATERPDPIEVEETALLIFASALRAAYDARLPRASTRPRRPDTLRAHRRAVDDVRAALAASLEEGLTLDDAARIACLSPFHLSRLFRQHTGQTLSQYRTNLRLRAALERVADTDDDLTTAALAAGFSSHSHFTNRFRQRFGFPPSAIRRDNVAHLLRDLRKSVQADAPPLRRSSSRGRLSAA